MNAFDEALDRFHRDGSFIYQDACLSVDRLERLKASLVDLDLNNTYQFHLSNVRLDPQAKQVAPVLSRQSTCTSRSNSSSSSESASASSNEVSHYSGASGFDDPGFSENLNFI